MIVPHGMNVAIDTRLGCTSSLNVDGSQPPIGIWSSSVQVGLNVHNPKLFVCHVLVVSHPLHALLFCLTGTFRALGTSKIERASH